MVSPRPTPAASGEDSSMITTRALREKRPPRFPRPECARGGRDPQLLDPSSPQGTLAAAASVLRTDESADFMAGYAMGMQQAHLQALGYVKRTGALEMGLLVCQQEQRRAQSRARAVELALACGAGRLTTALEALEKSFTAAESARHEAQRALDRAVMRIESLEARTLWAAAARAVRCVWGRGRRALQRLPLSWEQSLCTALAAAWLGLCLASGLGGRRLSPRLRRYMQSLRHWTWLLFIASSHRAARRLLAREIFARQSRVQAAPTAG